MKIINVALRCIPEKQHEYEAFIAQLVAGSRAESGNLAYDHFKKLGSEHEYAIIEHWRDQAAVDFHNQTPHFQTFLAEIGPYLASEPEIIRVDYEPA
ncbi:putative quinol monooxygenase [Snodgrassella sp. CFCC 13594]|uniref:putative quinol monooxygenase n=1 Tax=Snodgrassella sp. CFCC 13594 TaxID=1775559 RepID=UPI00082F3335|nr:putative quinol monooxygenase [Snodgrassella sp. CFCC 13594]